MISNAWTCRPGPQGGCSAFGSPTHIHTKSALHKLQLPTVAGFCPRSFFFLSFYCVREILGRLGRDKATHNPKNRCRSRTKQGPRPVSSVVGLRRRILQTISFIYITKRSSQPTHGHGSIIIRILLRTTPFFQIIIHLIFLTLSLTTCLIQKKLCKHSQI